MAKIEGIDILVGTLLCIRYVVSLWENDISLPSRFYEPNFFLLPITKVIDLLGHLT